MKAKAVVLNVVMLAVGVAAGYCLYSAGNGAAAEVADKPAVKSEKIRDVGASSSERALSARICELEALYKATPVPEKSVVEDDQKYWKPLIVQNSDGSASVSVMLGNMSFDLKKSLEKLRKKDPEEFERRVKFRREMSDSIADGYDERIRFFEQIDTSWLGEEERENFNQFVDTLKTASDCSRRSGQWDLPFEQRKQVDAYTFRNQPAIPQNYPRIRDTLLKRTAEVMGLDDEAAADFVAAVNDIERMTSRYTTVSLPPVRNR